MKVNTSRFLTSEDVARMFDVSRGTITKRALAGKFPMPIHVDGKNYWPKKLIGAFQRYQFEVGEAEKIRDLISAASKFQKSKASKKGK